MDKPFKTYDELLELLESRRVCFENDNDKARALHILKQVGYYNLINGYKDIFLAIYADGTELFKDGTTVDEIYALYEFDRELRDIFFKSIIDVEVNIKSLLSYEFSKKYGHDNYLIFKNFNTDGRDSNKQVASLIATIHSQIAKKSTDPSIAHYLNNYGYIPLWVLNNILTLGTISKFYSLMKQQDKQAVSASFDIMDNELQSMLMYLSSVRNFCAHGNRLYCYKSRSPLVDMPLHEELQIHRKRSGEYFYGKRDLFACIIALKYLTPKDAFSRLISEIEIVIDILCEKMRILTKDKLLFSMGFPGNWKDIAR